MKAVIRNLPRSSTADSRSGPPDVLPVSIRNSRLMSVGGYEVFEGFLNREGFALMLSEAVRLSEDAYVSDVPVSDEEEIRGGTPARRFKSVPGGCVQEAFYQSPRLIKFLSERCNASLTPLGGQGTYSFYAETGDYLAIHRDIEACDLAVITCLYNGPRRDDYGGALCLYPTRLFEPLSRVRATPERGALTICLEPGQTIIMFGGIIPHTLLPVSAGQTRIVSVLCYRAEW
jgi:hypothetical protein